MRNVFIMMMTADDRENDDGDREDNPTTSTDCPLGAGGCLPVAGEPR